jgi:hypothetical protein
MLIKNHNNKTHYLFLDESGIAELTDETYRYFLLTSVAADKEAFDEIEGYFSLIKRKYELECEFPFHTHELLENQASENYLTPAQAREGTYAQQKLMKQVF